MRGIHFVPLLLLLLLGVPAAADTIAATDISKDDDDSWSRVSNAIQFVSDFVLTKKTTTKHSLDVKVHGLSIIGAGFSRSGTKSLELALHQLKHTIYDTASMMEHNHQWRWVQAAKEWKTNGESPTAVQLVQEMEDLGYTATLDSPMNHFAILLHKIRPQAKVIFGVRDTPQKWFASLRQVHWTLGHFNCKPWNFIMPDLAFNYEITDTIHGPPFVWKRPRYPQDYHTPLPWYDYYKYLRGVDDDDMEESWIAIHEQFLRDCQDQIASTQFLKFNVKQGWEPLVEFLDLDPTLAQQDFPRSNDIQTLQMIRKTMDIIAMGLPVWISLIVYLMYRVLKIIIGGILGGGATSNNKSKVE